MWSRHVFFLEDGVCRPWRPGTSTGHKMWEMHWSRFKLPSIQTRDVRIVYPMAAHIITPIAGWNHAHFMTNDLRCCMVFHVWSYNVNVLPGIKHRRALKSCIPFRLTLGNLLIPYSRESDCISINATTDITERWTKPLIGNDPVFIKFRHFLVNIPSYYSKHNMIFWANTDLLKYFTN